MTGEGAAVPEEVFGVGGGGQQQSGESWLSWLLFSMLMMAERDGNLALVDGDVVGVIRMLVVSHNDDGMSLVVAVVAKDAKKPFLALSCALRELALLMAVVLLAVRFLVTAGIDVENDDIGCGVLRLRCLFV